MKGRSCNASMRMRRIVMEHVRFQYFEKHEILKVRFALAFEDKQGQQRFTDLLNLMFSICVHRLLMNLNV